MTLPVGVPYSTIKANLAAHVDELDRVALMDEATPAFLEGWMAHHRKLIAGHGTRAKYHGKYEDPCRCDLCVKANSVFNKHVHRRKYQRDYKARKAKEQRDFELSLLEDAL